MNPLMVGLIVAGIVAGLGAALVIAAFTPVRPDLLAALAGPTRGDPFEDADETQPTGAIGRLQHELETRLSATRLTSPDADLAVIGMRRGEYLTTRIAISVAALVIGPIYSLIFAMFRLPIPPAIPAGIGVIAAAVAWLAVGSHTASKAESARKDMRQALVAFLQLVALHRAGGSGIGAALDQAAATSDTWAFRRIGQAMSSAVRAGKPASAGLGHLAEDLGIDELADLAAIADTAATAGATIYTTLMARAASLRSQLHADQIAGARIASGRMSIPKAILSMAVMAFLIYPAIATLTAT
ncbi:MAG: hypothetical protein BGO26_16540 [Actinobacteria bacterium 69-20]|nr:type II secretion system F family protein [Actinomycetota bacterium]OJV27886.1 MAG: hypothetical protein BGO26_16540 [Actinobacteria bacterium 69-20]